MIERNPHLNQLSASYLFSEVARRKQAFLQKHPDISLIDLSIGDTTQPLAPHIVSRLLQKVQELGTQEGYTGYGPVQGVLPLREAISKEVYQSRFHPDEIFISDGAKCDTNRLQFLIGSGKTVACQDPTYPAYVDNSLLFGQDVLLYPCMPKNDFFPDLPNLPRADLIYFCSPNNPTGNAATKKQLTDLVHFAQKNGSLILFDAAYRDFIQGDSFPRSIYEIEGAEEVAIEIGSFSKSFGFTGVRLGWSLVPTALLSKQKTSVRNDWARIFSTLFNGASNLAQAAGVAALEKEGLAHSQKTTQIYLENARKIKEALNTKGIQVYGGTSAPYLWAHFPGQKSWDLFDQFLEKNHLICTPGVGFGSSGEEFVRFSAFATPENINQAVKRL